MATEFKDSVLKAFENYKLSHLESGATQCSRVLQNERPSLFTSIKNGQDLAGTGALVFEGELLEIPVWN